MTIIFEYLFTQTPGGFICRVPVRILQGPVLGKGIIPTVNETAGIDLRQWLGKNLNVVIEKGVHVITGLAD
ncbi:hypothetical protein [Spirosoma fluminis]